MTTQRSGRRQIATGIDFGIRGDSLIVKDVSREIGLNPTSAFEKGEPYIGKQRCGSQIVPIDRVRPFGVWRFCTSESLNSGSVEEHAKYLIEMLTPGEAAIRRLLDDSEFYVRISIWFRGDSFYLSSARLAELSSFAEGLSVTCWEA